MGAVDHQADGPGTSRSSDRPGTLGSEEGVSLSFQTASSVFTVLFSALIFPVQGRASSCLLYYQGTRLSSKISGVPCQVTCLSLWSKPSHAGYA